MKTSNKVLWGGLIVVILFITALIIIMKVHYNKELKNVKETLTEETKEVKPFSSLHIRGSFWVRFTQEAGQKVQIKTDEQVIDKIETYVEDGCLFITTALSDRKAKRQEVAIASEILKGLTMEGDSYFSSKTNLSLDTVSITLKDKCHANFKGKAEKVVITGAGVSRLYAGSLTTKKCKVKTMDEAHVHINATEKLDINARGKSHVNYTGNPDKVSINTIDEATAKGE